MPSFDLSAAVDPMEFRLRKGDEFRVIPEPSNVQVQAFLNARNIEAEKHRKQIEGLPDDATAETLAKVLTEKKSAADHRRNAEIYAALCSGVPSADELAKLPYREFNEFARWVSEELLNPEAATGAGSSQD